MRVSYVEVHRRTNTETISELVKKRRWTWIGHVLRMDNSCLPRVALTWAPEGKRKRGKPKVMWRRSEWQWVSILGLNWGRTGGRKQGILEEHNFRPYSPYQVNELMMMMMEYLGNYYRLFKTEFLSQCGAPYDSFKITRCKNLIIVTL